MTPLLRPKSRPNSGSVCAAYFNSSRRAASRPARQAASGAGTGPPKPPGTPPGGTPRAGPAAPAAASRSTWSPAPTTARRSDPRPRKEDRLVLTLTGLLIALALLAEAVQNSYLTAEHR